MSVYLVGKINILDQEQYGKYAEAFPAVFGKYGGEVVVVADDVEKLEGDWDGERLVVLRFPTREAARKWYDSPEYQDLIKMRLSASEGTLVMAEEFVMP